MDYGLSSNSIATGGALCKPLQYGTVFCWVKILLAAAC